MSDERLAFRAGFCGIIGRPNVGKSTFLNCVLGQKLAVVTPKPQTTRTRILGVKNLPGAQVVLVDTPGIHRSKSELNRYMVEEAFRAMKEVDALVFMVEAPRPRHGEAEEQPFAPGPGNELILERLRLEKKPTVLAINKVDTLKNKSILLPFIDGWQRMYEFVEIVPISATEGLGVGDVLEAVVRMLPEGKPLFPEEMLTDRAERFLVAELIREQIFLLLRDEVPYSTAITIEGWEEGRKGSKERQLQDEEDETGDAKTVPGVGLVTIEATIHVERESQKGIVIGKAGRMIKQIGMRARQEIERLLGCRVHLTLFVRVDPDWSKDAGALRRLGYV